MTRVEPPMTAGERETLVGFLDYYRATLAVKCEGLDADQLRQRAVPPSSLSLLGLVRHSVEVERNWFRRVLSGEAAPYRYCSDDDPDGDFDNVDNADVEEAFASWQAEIDNARALTAAHSLDDTVIRKRTGEEVSLRWILVHLIEEYARHAGHADLLRERIDGVVGD